MGCCLVHDAGQPPGQYGGTQEYEQRATEIESDPAENEQQGLEQHQPDDDHGGHQQDFPAAAAGHEKDRNNGEQHRRQPLDGLGPGGCDDGLLILDVSEQRRGDFGLRNKLSRREGRSSGHQRWGGVHENRLAAQRRGVEIGVEHFVGCQARQRLVVGQVDRAVGPGNSGIGGESRTVERHRERQRRRHDPALQVPQYRAAQDAVIVRPEPEDTRLGGDVGEAAVAGGENRHPRRQRGCPARQLVRGTEFRRLRHDDAFGILRLHDLDQPPVLVEDLVVGPLRGIDADDQPVGERGILHVFG